MNCTVSMVVDAKSTDTRDGDAVKLVGAIKAGKWAEPVTEIRMAYNEALAEADGRTTDAKRAVDDSKKALPGILWSGTFSQRGSEHLTSHSGFLCADIDDLDCETLSLVRGKLEADLHVFAVFLSPTGFGLKAVFRVPADAARHRDSFFAVRDHIRDLCNIAIDEACKDIARLCFVSLDPEAYLNTAAAELPVPSPAVVERDTKPTDPVNLSARQRIAVTLLGEITWTAEARGLCLCPGQARHTTGNGARDCEVHLDGAPTVHCLHNSCQPVVDAMNRELRSRIGREEQPAIRLNNSPVKPATEAGKPHLTFPPVESWPESVSTAEMLEAITGEIRRYCALPEHGDVIAALWAMWTYVFDEFTTSPMLRVTSPTKRCGKTTLLDFMARICQRPLPASNCSPAALFRVIERDQPTLLLDEADTFFGSNPDLVGIINSGHTKAAAYVIRMVGEGKNMEPRQFSTWAPKLIAGIGRVTDTIEDRSIVLELKRKPASERLARVSRFDATELRARLNRWAEDAANELRRDQSDFSELANDRANDNWQPMIAIAATAGDEWRSKAIAAAHASSSPPGEGEDSIAIQLLADLRAVFGDRLADRMASAELASALHEMEGRLWSEFGQRQRPISPNQVARLLKPFGVLPRSMKLDQRVCRGYFKDDFTEAFSLYVPSPHDSNRYHAITPESIDENGDFHPLPLEGGSTPDTGVSTNKHRVCSAVAVRSHPADKEAAVYV